MSFDKEQAKKDIKKGVHPTIIAFKIGFQACCESVMDKGFSDLDKLLKYEHDLIE